MRPSAKPRTYGMRRAASASGLGGLGGHGEGQSTPFGQARSRRIGKGEAAGKVEAAAAWPSSCGLGASCRSAVARSLARSWVARSWAVRPVPPAGPTAEEASTAPRPPALEPRRPVATDASSAGRDGHESAEGAGAVRLDRPTSRGRAQLERGIDSYLRLQRGSFGVAVRDLAGGVAGGVVAEVGAEARFELASLYKLLLMYESAAAGRGPHPAARGPDQDRARVPLRRAGGRRAAGHEGDGRRGGRAA